MLRIFANYQKISESTDAVDHEESSNGFDGNGIPFKAKLIGMEDLPVDRDEKVCHESLMRLKSIVRVRGEHKQKIQLNLGFHGVQVIDELTKVELASHEVRRISFVITDPYDPRAFGYIYNTSDERHQFWAIKTERLAQLAVFTMKDIFDEVQKTMNPSNSIEPEKDPLSSTSVSADEVTESSQQPWFDFTPNFTPSAKYAPPTVQATTTSLFDDTWGGNSLATTPQTFATSEQQSTLNTDPWGFSEPVAPLKQPAPRVDSPVNLFSLPPPPSLTRRSTTTQPLPPTTTNENLFPPFTKAPPTFPVNDSVFIQPIEQTSSVSQQPSTDFFNSMPVSSINFPPTTNLFGEFDFLGDSSSELTAAARTDDPFFSSSSSAKAFQ